MRVEYIDHMGSDLTVTNSARVSFDKESDWVYGDYCESCNDHHGPYLSNQDQKLISYLAKHGHFTPFTHAVITVRETVPIFVARQRFKHTVGFTYNEVSRRYVSDEPEFYFPDVWRKKAENVKQGSSDEVVGLEDVKEDYEYLISYCKDIYEHFIANGVAPEQARMVLPQSMYTSYYCTGSLAAFARAYKLRTDAHAQKEIQELAVQWDEIISPLFPHSWKALTE